MSRPVSWVVDFRVVGEGGDGDTACFQDLASRAAYGVDAALRLSLKRVKDDAKEAYIVAVLLTEKPDDTKAQLARVQMSVQYENTALTCFTGDKEGPKEWTLNSMADVTVVVANKGKVTATFGYNSINETDVPKVREALKNAK